MALHRYVELIEQSMLAKEALLVETKLGQRMILSVSGCCSCCLLCLRYFDTLAACQLAGVERRASPQHVELAFSTPSFWILSLFGIWRTDLLD